MWRTCGAIPSTPFESSARRCSTPKRCCSSTTQSAEPGEARRRARSARGCRRPGPARRWRAARAPPGAARPASPRSAARTASPPRASSRSRVAACCSASVSVGAISTAWKPASSARSIEYSATTVLPDPTSPISSRCIGSPESRSPSISSKARELVVGRLERQRLDPAPDQLPGLAQPRRRPGRAVRPLPGRQDRLVEEQLFEGEPLARHLDVVLALGEVRGLDRVGRPRSPRRTRSSAGSGSITLPTPADRLLHPLPDPLGFQLLGRRVDGDELGGARVPRCGFAGSVRAVASSGDRRPPPDGHPRPRQELVFGHPEAAFVPRAGEQESSCRASASAPPKAG